MAIVRMSDLDLAGKRVLIRQDLNVPVADGRVTSDQRIVASLPTLKLALPPRATVTACGCAVKPGGFGAPCTTMPTGAETVAAFWLSTARAVKT